MADIDDPFRPKDSVVRPRPGGGRRPASDSTVMWQSTPAASPPVEAEPVPAPLADVLAAGLNPLVQAASPLLLLAGRLRGTLSGPDVGGVRQYALDEFRRFEQRAGASGIPNEVVLAARYALASTVDEAVLSTPWGAQSEWSQQTLLIVLHREAWGGEKFFEMLERASRDPARHIDLLELQYLCLAVGFRGKYHVLDRGQSGLMDVQRELYRKIREQRGARPPELSLRWQGVQDRRNRLIRYVPWWVVGAGALAILAITFVLYSRALAGPAGDIQAALNKIGTEGFDAPRTPVVVHGPTLKQLLAPEENGGNLRVDEQNGRTVVTLLGSGLFASGSATVSETFDPLLQRVGDALGKVSGRVLVVGHTDDQPLRSLRYADNFELSRERAHNVVQILLRRAGTAGRLQWSGAGSSQPAYTPPSDPENRARNRRVEIIHIPG